MRGTQGRLAIERTWRDAAAELRKLRAMASRTLKVRAYEHAGVMIWLMLGSVREKFERAAARSQKPKRPGRLRVIHGKKVRGDL
jgi:hypothetical protein